MIHLLLKLVSKKILPALLLVCLITNCNGPAGAETEESESSIQEMREDTITSITFDLTELVVEYKMPTPVTVDIAFDHYFKTEKTFRAYPLRDILAPYLKQLDIDSTTEAAVTFYCTDGYKPIQKLSDLYTAEGFIAFKDESVTEPNQNWPKEVQKKMRPFYIVWKDVPYENDLLNWSYGLYQIKIDKNYTVYDPITPKDNEAALAGFSIYKKNCIKCHAINKIGGELGPDFNHPKNITEYWDTENIWEYAKDPQSFRHNAKMPPVVNLEREEFEEVLAYLEYIREVKIEE